MARNYRYISGDSHLEIDAKWWVGRVPKGNVITFFHLESSVAP